MTGQQKQGRDIALIRSRLILKRKNKFMERRSPEESSLHLESTKQDDLEMHKRDTVEVLSLDEVAGDSFEQLAEEAIRQMTIVQKPSEGFMSHMRKKLGIPEGVSYEDGVRDVVMRDLENYKEKIEAVRARAREQAEYCQKYAVEHGYLDHKRPVRVVISSAHIGKGIPSIGAAKFYDPEEKRAVIQIENENWLIAHEVGHMLSHDQETNQVGFGMHIEGKKEQKITCQFLNEGTTVLWEQDTVTDGSRNELYEDPLELYRWYRDTTLSLLREIGLSKDDLYRAYFGQSEARRKLDEAIERRFHCSMEDLTVLNFSIRQPETETILRGESFMITIKEGMNESVVENLEKLARIFPNVVLVRQTVGE